MISAREDVEHRFPIWKACSDFFIDNELNECDINHIVNVCADSKYTMRELEKIMFLEVWPAFIINLFSVAGNWTGWSDEYIKERVLAKYRFRLYFSWRLNPIKRFYCSRWEEVELRIKDLRG